MLVKPFDYAELATLPGRRIEPAVMAEDGTVRSGDITLYASSPDRSLRPYTHSICVQPHIEKRAPFTVGLVRLETQAHKATLTLTDRLSNPLIEVDVVIHKDAPDDMVCDLGYGIAPGTVIDEATTLLIPDFHVLWPGKSTTNAITTFVEDCAWFETFADNGCATGISCTPLHMQAEGKESTL